MIDNKENKQIYIDALRAAIEACRKIAAIGHGIFMEEYNMDMDMAWDEYVAYRKNEAGAEDE